MNKLKNSASKLIVFCRNCVIGVIFFVVPSASAMSDGSLLPLDNFHETFSISVNSAGGMLVGMWLGANLNANIDLSKLAVQLPRNPVGQLCLQITTRDGRYYGEQIFDTSRTNGGRLALSLNSKYARELANYSYKDLAVLLELRENCKKNNTGIIVPAVLMGNDNKSSFYFYINSKSPAASLTALNKKGDSIAYGQCDEIKDGARTAFDRMCFLTIPDRNLDSVLVIRLRTIGFTGSFYDEDFPLALDLAK
jgi:hypothetical protein